MGRQLTYRDAIKILGEGDNKALNVIDKLLGGAIITAVAVTGHLEIGSLLHIRDELVDRSQKLLNNFGERVRGSKGKKRADLLIAAHAAIAINAYFDVLKEAGLPIDPDRLELTDKDQLRLAGSSSASSSRKLVDALISAPVPLPSAHLPFEKVSARMQLRYQQISQGMLTFASGLSVWDELNDTLQEQLAIALNEKVPELAKEKYEESYRSLAAECVEFQIWADAIDNAATRYAIEQIGNDVNRSFSGLALELEHLATGPSNSQAPKKLSQAYKAQLERPIVEETQGEAHLGLNVPILKDAYINPACLVSECGPSDRPADESWWSGSTHWDDVQWFLAGYLTSDAATQAPLMVLGQPGSGKSLLTKILAARLPDNQFMPIRVELRGVPADASLEVQIETAVLGQTGERFEWSDLVRDAGDALPVLMLDGFDELLQSTGISHSDYLEKVRDFQRRELDLDRRVAVLVTSRTVVADRVRFPEGAVAVKLEPFHEQQIGQWLDEWNRVNSKYFKDSELRALDVHVVMQHAELAQQPLLLMMLAFYDADSNLLQQSGHIGQAELYERLLDKFIRREIAKQSPGASEDEIQTYLTLELTQLSVAALAMFNRGRQFVTEDELKSDLLALMEDSSRQEPNSISFGGRIAPARLVLGRFFFIHESQANIDSARFATYEFLHATFGEYLVAWIVFRTLKRAIAVRAAEEISMSFSGTNITQDDRLYALLSFALLTDRLQIGAFLRELMARMPDLDQTQVRNILRQLFQNVLSLIPANQYSAYRPRSVSVTARYSMYSANLLILNTLASAQGVQASEIFGQFDPPLDAWHRITLLWQSQLDNSALDGLIKAVQVSRITKKDGSRELTISFSSSPDSARDIEVFANLSWILHEQIPLSEPAITNLSANTDRIISIAKFTCSDHLDMLLHTLYPLLKKSDRGVGLIMSSPDSGRAISAANALINVLYQQLDEPDQRRVELIINPWLYMLQSPTHDELLNSLAITSGTASSRAISIVARTALTTTGVDGFLQAATNLSAPSIGSVGYWATIITALAQNDMADQRNLDQVSSPEFVSPEFVRSVLEEVDPVRMVRDEPEAAVDALKVARLYDLIGWSGDQGLSILALMPKEQLAVVPEIEIVYVLERAVGNSVPSAAIELVRQRWLSAGGGP